MIHHLISKDASDEAIREHLRNADVTGDSVCYTRMRAIGGDCYLVESFTRHAGSKTYCYAREHRSHGLDEPNPARYFKRYHPLWPDDVGHARLIEVGTDLIASLYNPLHTPRVSRLTAPLSL